MDIEHLDGLFAEFYRIMKNDGLLYLLIVHPVSYPGTWICDEDGVKTSKAIKDYVLEYKITHNFCGKVTTHFHRPLSCYLNLAVENHFQIIHMEEPCIKDDKENSSNLPIFLMIELRKQ